MMIIITLSLPVFDCLDNKAITFSVVNLSFFLSLISNSTVQNYSVFYIDCYVRMFKESHGTVKEFLMSDVVGLSTLYEATHLRVHGEDVLDI
ncbi:putative lyase [Rosa chinensis]|uniref:Putative lyase n=1 Tax=Rosa chinensis TaxID=74649 RepID=A0A2P6QSI6_ROSCH|nr:putative lyase [Rosa chinensis]